MFLLINHCHKFHLKTFYLAMIQDIDYKWIDQNKRKKITKNTL